MGIRFDRTTRRATNGPMIFFTDPSAEIDLCEEIRGAISSRLSFYAYRRPGDIMISFGSSESAIEGLSEPGFVIAPFNPNDPVITIPYRAGGKGVSSKETQPPFPARSTTPEEHADEIAVIQDTLRQNGGGKIVAARAIVNDGELDVAETFTNLCHRYPKAFVFAFSTPQTGCWIGASPELLMEGHGDKLRTMALAGTRPAGTPGDWDDKNVEEQAMVTDYICDCLKRHDIVPEPEPSRTVGAGTVEHICTPIMASTGQSFTSASLTALLRDLSPTPALCGLPKELAQQTINDTEKFQRGCYGGFCGPYKSPSEFYFSVILRCAQATAERYCLYVGGGITLKSNPTSEWEETELKAQTLLMNIAP